MQVMLHQLASRGLCVLSTVQPGRLFFPGWRCLCAQQAVSGESRAPQTISLCLFPLRASLVPGPPAPRSHLPARCALQGQLGHLSVLWLSHNVCHAGLGAPEPLCHPTLFRLQGRIMPDSEHTDGKSELGHCTSPADRKPDGRGLRDGQPWSSEAWLSDPGQRGPCSGEHPRVGCARYLLSKDKTRQLWTRGQARALPPTRPVDSRSDVGQVPCYQK